MGDTPRVRSTSGETERPGVHGQGSSRVQVFEHAQRGRTLSSSSSTLILFAFQGITSKHSWEEALRTVYNHPHYKLVPTLAERKALFARHIQVQREIEREERHQKGLRDREEFKKLLQETPSITSATRYSEVLDLLGENAIWLAVDSPKERSVLFDEHVAQLRRQEAEQKRERRRRCQEKYNKLLTVSLESEIKYDTPWKMALPLIQSSYDFRQDADLQSMDLADLLIGFETHIKNLERVEHRREAVVKTEERRKQRMARRDFKLLLDELEAKGALTPVTSWSEIYPTIKDRGELDAIISQQGSTPLDLFWDRLHKLQEGYINEAQRIIDALRTQLGDHWIEKTDEATIASFVDKDNNHLVEHVCKHLLKRKNKDAMSGELTSEERQRLTSKVDQWRRDRRKLIDKLKHCIKHFDPPIRIDSTFAQYAPLLAAHPDGAAIADEQIIHYYFDKYLRHLKKKASGEKSEGDD